MKTTGTATALAVLALWLGYYLGYHNGVEQERRAWLATEQAITLPPPSVAAVGRNLQRPRISAARTFYSNPHSGRTFIATYGPPPINVPDPRNILTK
ncbi:MAG: hypothetical protein ACLQU3_24285 [Limisphaerales bacterium]